MNVPNLPAYLQNRAIPGLNEIAIIGLGGILPPHISIQGNTFTLIDATGNEQPHGPILAACVADISPHNCKRYYDKKWEPGSNDPPVCWSANGLAPSRDAPVPQSPTCGACLNNVRGSAVSAISGAAIKACRDEKWLALIVPQYPTMRFQLILTPGSFKNWQAYIEKCKQSQTDLSDVVTQINFEPKVNGVLQFAATAYIDEATYKMREVGYHEKAFDTLVGRNDVPRQMALPAPNAQPPTTPYPPGGLAAPAQTVAQAMSMPVSPAPQTGFVPGAAPSGNAGFGTAPATPEQPQRRRRRTNAEIQAATAATSPNAVDAPVAVPIQGFQPAPGPAAAPVAPFLAEQPPANNFGIQAGTPPNPELQSAINSLFGPK